ncbi:MAG: SpoIID/LytB domain-containing protein [Eubacteriales bacterium]|nr:SpoIID/LytB domain-containing protein [Eubacteriales bacterium]
MVRKVFVIILSVILLSLAIAPAAALADVSYDIIRVKLSVGTPASINVYLDGNYSVAQDGNITLLRQSYTVKLESGVLKLYLGDTLLYSGSAIKLIQHAPTAGLNNFIWLNNANYGDCSYLGDMEFIISDGSITVINHVYLEEYLYGVVPYEMSDSWPIEALKAQAVAARSYAIRCMNGTGTYDLLDTSANQVYHGYNAAYANAIAAVEGTSKQILTYSGSVVCTYYSASNGGYTDIPYHRWGGGYDLDYFVITEDPYDAANPSSLYEGVFFPVSFDSIDDITTDDNVTGTPNKTNAVLYIKQSMVNSGKLSGYGVTSVNDFELTGVLDLYAHTYDVSASGSEDHSRLPKSGVNDCVDFIMATGDFSVMVGETPVTVEDLTFDLRYFDGANGNTSYLVFNNTSLCIFLIEAEMDGEAVAGWWIYQKRYGHGCGMSQRGAQQRANSGDESVRYYNQILAFYYPGTAIETLDIDKPELTPIEAPGNTNATIINCSVAVNVRSDPSTSHTLIGTLAAGARVEVTSPYVTAEWHQIDFGGQTAYVYAYYVGLDTVIFSQTYTIDRENALLDGVADGTTPASLVSNLYYESGSVTIYDQQGAAYTGGSVGTGMTAKLFVGTDEKDALGIIVPGDANGDGIISITDYTLVRLDILGLKSLEGLYIAAADVNNDEQISITDYTLIRLDILGLKSIH